MRFSPRERTSVSIPIAINIDGVNLTRCASGDSIVVETIIVSISWLDSVMRCAVRHAQRLLSVSMCTDFAKEAGIRVLIASDRLKTARAVAACLRPDGIEVILVDSPTAAVECSRKLLPSLLVTELMFAGLSGLETAMRIREVAPQCPVLCMSGRLRRPESLDEVLTIVRAVKQLCDLQSNQIFWLDLAVAASSDGAARSTTRQTKALRRLAS